MTWEMIVITVIVAVVLLAIALIYVGQRMPKQDEDPLSQRLADFSQRGEAVSLDEIELSQPFTERVIYPILRQFGEMAAKNTPQNVGYVGRCHGGGATGGYRSFYSGSHHRMFLYDRWHLYRDNTSFPCMVFGH